MPCAGPNTGVPFSSAQGLRHRGHLSAAPLLLGKRHPLGSFSPAREQSHAESPRSRSKSTATRGARIFSPQGGGRRLVSVLCALYFPCVVCTHPFIRELRSQILIQVTSWCRALRDSTRPRMVQQRHLLLDASAAPRGRRRLLPWATAVWFPALTSADTRVTSADTRVTSADTRSQLRLSRSPEKAWCDGSRCGPGR